MHAVRQFHNEELLESGAGVHVVGLVLLGPSFVIGSFTILEDAQNVRWRRPPHGRTEVRHLTV